MSGFICPTCGEPLTRTDKSYLCDHNHHYDIARSGYVNLHITQQKKEKQHGDDKLMIRARTEFLNTGYYKVLQQELSKMISKYIKSDDVILDAGCGECWYTAHIYEDLIQNNVKPLMYGIDISKNALEIGARRNPDIQLAVASAYHIPVHDHYCDMVLSLFAPYSSQEFTRILNENGLIVRVLPLEKHLWSLKKVIYDQAYENEMDSYELEGFEIVEKQEIREVIHLSSNEDINNLFMMTPYYYKTGEKDQLKLKHISSLDTEIQFGVVIYRRKVEI